eukprot:3011282-Pyramimonas_sp.AAC.1
MVLLTVEAGEAVVDTAAGQGLIGAQALERHSQRLKKLGLKIRLVEPRNRNARGVGGGTRVLHTALAPTGIQGKEGRRAPFASSRPSGNARFQTDLDNNVMSLRRSGVETPMRRMPSGHRTIRIDELQSPRRSFRCPASLFQQHPGLKESDFQCDTT